MAFPARVRIVEVGPRDGLQNEALVLPAAVRVELIERLAEAGLGAVEAGAFVSPRWVPQMAGSAQVLATLRRKPGVAYPVLVPNLQGLEAALAAGASEVAVFAAASEAFSRKNINCSVAESLERFEGVLAEARRRDLPVRGYVSCVLGCPYQGEVAPEAVADVAGRLVELGCYQVSLGDTIGVGTPLRARAMLAAVTGRVAPERLALHFHDTYGQALANIFSCLDSGVTTLDSSVAGLGGCPYAKGAAGNVATEDLVFMLHGLGIDTGIDLDRLAATGAWISTILGRASASRAGRALAAVATGRDQENQDDKKT